MLSALGFSDLVPLSQAPPDCCIIISSQGLSSIWGIEPQLDALSLGFSSSMGAFPAYRTKSVSENGR